MKCGGNFQTGVYVCAAEDSAPIRSFFPPVLICVWEVPVYHTNHLVAIYDAGARGAFTLGFQAGEPRWENRKLRRPGTKFTKRDISDIIASESG